MAIAAVLFLPVFLVLPVYFRLRQAQQDLDIDSSYYLFPSLLTLGIILGVIAAFRRAKADVRPRAAGLLPEQTGRRYKGTTPFQDQEIDRKTFFGRAREGRSLLSLVLAEKLVVLFAKSGMGKTSLLNAGLVKPLRDRGYFPIVVRLADQQHGPVASVFDGIRRAAQEARVDCVGGGKASLWHFFKTAELWSEGDDLLRPVLIFDQFEELVTLHTPERRRQLVAQLAELVRGRAAARTSEPGLPPPESRSDAGPPDLKIVLSLREDYLAHLEDLARDIPGILHHRFRLGPLTREDARAAIVEPARLADAAFDTVPFAYREETVDEILAFLAKRRSGGTMTNEEVVESDEVEPVQLQLICQYLEEKVRARDLELPPDTGGDAGVEISPDDVGGERHMQRVLEGFYNRTLAAIWRPGEVRRVRRLCEKRLISGAGRRLTEDGDEIRRKYKISEERLQQLVDARLLRSELRLGGAFYELSHDTLVEPILRSRKKRFARLRWISAGAALAGVLSLAALWVTVVQEAQVSARLVKSETDPVALAATKLDEIERGYRKWVRSRKMYGAMAYALGDVAHRFPELRDRAHGIGNNVRDGFNQKHDITPPELDAADWANIPAGRFMMGSGNGEAGRDPDEKLHPVEISEFRMLKHEVTNAELRRFHPAHRGPDDHPATNVSWFGAVSYAAWLGGRLPTEAEWEYAARAGTTTRYWSGDEEEDLARVGWYEGNSDSVLHPVGQKPANAWGLHDVHGNAREWVADWFGEYPVARDPLARDPDEAQIDPWGPPDGVARVIRGGSSLDPAANARAADRDGMNPEPWHQGLGFRVVIPGSEH